MSAPNWQPFIYIGDAPRRRGLMASRMTLADAQVGDRYRIVELTCDNLQQLFGMGLTPGAIVSVVQRTPQGSAIISLDQQRFCLNCELAQSVVVSPLRGESGHISLRTAPVGARLRVVGYAPTATFYKRKLLSMGLTPGTELEIVRHAPLGDPTDIRVRQFHLSLRKEEADALQVCEI